MGLAGIGVPVASAIMTAIDPERHTVIDFRALQSPGIATANRSLKFYLADLRSCRRIADSNGALN